MIVAQWWYSAIRKGHHEYASTYDFPLRIKFIEDYWIKSKRDFNLSEYIRCAKELEEEGVKAVVGSCGLIGGMQEELANAADVPVFSSNLLIVPLVLRAIRRDRKVGILTDSSEILSKEDSKILRGCGIQPESPRIVIKGMTESEYRDVWFTQFGGGEVERGNWELEEREVKKLELGELNVQEVEEAVVSVAKKMVSENPDIGAIVLECTEMPLYAKAIREATGLLVFDSVSLVKYVHTATVSVH
jgi:aspartate/glutamate racemase